MINKTVINEWLHCGALVSLEDGRVLLGWGERNWQGYPSNSEPSFYSPDFFLEHSSPWFIHANSTVISIEELLKALDTCIPTPKKDYQWINSHHLLFQETYSQLQQLFSAGELAKAVPFVHETSPQPMEKDQLKDSLINALNYLKTNSAYIYGFWGPAEGVLGVTPEILFRFCGPDAIQTMACAGTKRIQDSNEVFLNDPKELHEHQLVVQGICESLKVFGDVNIGERHLLKLTRLAHLITPITLKYHSKPTFNQVVQALHPTPALGAFPRKPGMRWLESFQKKIDRRRFGAPVGYLIPASSQASCYVSIRNVQWINQQMTISAGCGLVQASNCDKEWNEIALKFQAIKEMLAL